MGTGENSTVRSFMTVTSHHYSFDEIEKDEIDGACSIV